MKIHILFWVILIAGCSCERPAPPEEETKPIELLWSIPYYYVGSTVVSSPLPLGDSLVIMSAGRDIIAVEQATGAVRWKTFVDSMTNIQSSIFVNNDAPVKSIA